MGRLPVWTTKQPVKKCVKSILDEGYISQQVFNCDKTGLFWKKRLPRIYITGEEKKMPGH